MLKEVVGVTKRIPITRLNHSSLWSSFGSDVLHPLTATMIIDFLGKEPAPFPSFTCVLSFSGRYKERSFAQEVNNLWLSMKGRLVRE